MKLDKNIPIAKVTPTDKIKAIKTIL